MIVKINVGGSCLIQPYASTTMSTVVVNDIFLENPYTGHAELTTLEADVLWEYAKLAQNVKQVYT